MKNIIKILFITTFFALISCKKDDDIAPIDQLPPATQIGAGTFGCLVNGTAYKETRSYFNCYYQFVNGEYYFALGGEDRKHNLFDQIILATNSAEIEQGMQYSLGCNEANSYYGEVAFTKQLLGTDTCGSAFGTFTITKLDFTNKIVSGTFEFDVTHPESNSVIEIRNGRFDTLFTQ